MTRRQARIFVWLVLLPLTIGVWIQFLPPCVFGCARIEAKLLAEPLPEPIKATSIVICPLWLRAGSTVGGA